MPKLLHLHVACAENRVIGRDGRLPWHLPEDLAFFHRETAGTSCIVGRISFRGWPRALADGRRPIVISQSGHVVPHPDSARWAAAGNPPDGAREAGPVVVGSLADALAHADAAPREISICGGERIYAETLALAGQRPLRLHLTLIHAEIAGDTRFPDWRHLPWQEIARRDSEDAGLRYTFHTLDLPA